MKASELLDQVLRSNYERAGRETGYWGRYYWRELNKKGGVATLKRMLETAKDDKIAKGWQSLLDAGRIDLSIEYTALDPRFSGLFTEAELAEAERRLERIPEYARPRDVDKRDLDPAEVRTDVEYAEGAVRRITVNAYERDRAARAACIARHGVRCAVCEMSFQELYGEIGRGFIHVHHRKPLALRRAEYKLRPTIDLVPVCPNCHAMLHTKSPPLGVDELREIMAARKS